MGELINGRTPEEIKAALELCNMISNRKNICESCPYNGECTPEGKPDQPGWDALVYIQRLESERDAALAKAPRWISVEDRTPKDRQIVYMHTSNGRTFKGIYLSHTGFERYKHGDGWTFVNNVIYWTTLPELPKEDA